MYDQTSNAVYSSKFESAQYDATLAIRGGH